jgi:cation:H+ antiporter
MTNSWHALFWTTPVVMCAAIVIGWAAETAQLYMSQGLALAILAWIQTSPEFAVEAVIAWQQKQNLMVANLTGSLRLLVGLGWPLVYFTHTFFSRHKVKGWPVISLKWFNGLEVLILLLGTLYFSLIWLKGSLTVGDSFFLFGIYAIYLLQLTKLPQGLSEEEKDLPWIGRKISKISKPWLQKMSLALVFILGAALLKVSTGPFLHGLEVLALSFGISSFFFIQWCAPFVSEFPEKVTAFQWARTGRKAPLALMNMASSNIVQWTLMGAMIPVIYSLSLKQATPIFFDSMQLEEIGLTLCQSFLSILFLMDLEIDLWNALTLLALWAFQFFFPSFRVIAIDLYGVCILIEVISLARKKKLFYALIHFRKQREMCAKTDKVLPR